MHTDPAGQLPSHWNDSSEGTVHSLPAFRALDMAPALGGATLRMTVCTAHTRGGCGWTHGFRFVQKALCVLRDGSPAAMVAVSHSEEGPAYQAFQRQDGPKQANRAAVPNEIVWDSRMSSQVGSLQERPKGTAAVLGTVTVTLG